MSGHPQVHRVPIDGEHLAAGRQRDQVAADAAAQIGETRPAAPRRRRARCRAAVSDEACSSPGRVNSIRPARLNFAAAAAAELILRGRRGDQIRRVVLAQRGGQGQRGLPRVAPGRHPGQQLLAPRRQQGRHLGRPSAGGASTGADRPPGRAGPAAPGGPGRHARGRITNCRRYRSRKVTGPRGPGTLSMLMPVSGTASSLNAVEQPGRGVPEGAGPGVGVQEHADGVAVLRDDRRREPGRLPLATMAASAAGGLGHGDGRLMPGVQRPFVPSGCSCGGSDAATPSRSSSAVTSGSVRPRSARSPAAGSAGCRRRAGRGWPRSAGPPAAGPRRHRGR